MKTTAAAAWLVIPWLVILAIKSLEAWAYVRLSGQPFEIPSLLRGEVPVAVAGLVVTPFALWLGFRWPLTRNCWRRRLMILVPAVATVAVLVSALRIHLWEAVGLSPGGTAGSGSPLLFSLASVFHVDVINISFMVALGQLLYVMRDRHDHMLRSARLEAQLADARLHLLQSRIQPHFLFNTLHTAGQLIRAARNREAREVLERLGLLLRRTLDARSALIPLATEVDLARAYLEIEAIRFSDRLRVHWDIDDTVEEAGVPALLIQPLIENAVRHGVARTTTPVTVTVRIRRQGGMAIVIVEDDGPGFDPESLKNATGTGLGNTAQRLDAAFGGEATLETSRAAAGGARVTLRFPWIEAVAR
jgi:signal transduction histidine kinase